MLPSACGGVQSLKRADVHTDEPFARVAGELCSDRRPLEIVPQNTRTVSRPQEAWDLILSSLAGRCGHGLVPSITSASRSYSSHFAQTGSSPGATLLRSSHPDWRGCPLRKLFPLLVQLLMQITNARPDALLYPVHTIHDAGSLAQV